MSPLWKEAYLTKKGRAVKLKCLKEMRVGLKSDAQPRIKKEMLTVYLRNSWEVTTGVWEDLANEKSVPWWGVKVFPKVYLSLHWSLTLRTTLCFIYNPLLYNVQGSLCQWIQFPRNLEKPETGTILSIRCGYCGYTGNVNVYFFLLFFN